MIAIADPRPPSKTLLDNLMATKYGSLEYYVALGSVVCDRQISIRELEDCMDWIENREKGKT